MYRTLFSLLILSAICIGNPTYIDCDVDALNYEINFDCTSESWNYTIILQRVPIDQPTYLGVNLGQSLISSSQIYEFNYSYVAVYGDFQFDNVMKMESFEGGWSNGYFGFDPNPALNDYSSTIHSPYHCTITVQGNITTVSIIGANGFTLLNKQQYFPISEEVINYFTSEWDQLQGTDIYNLNPNWTSLKRVKIDGYGISNFEIESLPAIPAPNALFLSLMGIGTVRLAFFKKV